MKQVGWMDLEQARDYLGFRTTEGFRGFVRRELADPKPRLKVYWLRGRRRFRQVELDACIEEQPRPTARQKTKGA